MTPDAERRPPSSYVVEVLPETMRVLEGHFSDPGVMKRVPLSADSGKKATFWPRPNRGEDGKPSGVLMRLGSCAEAVTGRASVFRNHSKDDGYDAIRCSHGASQVPTDDFSVVVRRPGDGQGCRMSVLTLVSADAVPGKDDPRDSRVDVEFARVTFPEMDDARMAAAMDSVLKARKTTLDKDAFLKAVVQVKESIEAEVELEASSGMGMRH